MLCDACTQNIGKIITYDTSSSSVLIKTSTVVYSILWLQLLKVNLLSFSIFSFQKDQFKPQTLYREAGEKKL